MQKQTILIVVVVAVVIVAGIFLLNQSSNQQSNQQAGTNETKPVAKGDAPVTDPKNPNFVLGNVVSAAADKIVFKAGLAELTAQLSADTKLVKQIKDSTTVKAVPATTSDFKAGVLIVVYYSGSPSNNVYTADRVQIISQ